MTNQTRRIVIRTEIYHEFQVPVFDKGNELTSEDQVQQAVDAANVIYDNNLYKANDYELAQELRMQDCKIVSAKLLGEHFVWDRP